jgi:hypothetical protein
MLRVSAGAKTGTCTSVITSKPAIRYHFKTGQRDRTQDYMTLYRAARDSGKYFFD